MEKMKFTSPSLFVYEKTIKFLSAIAVLLIAFYSTSCSDKSNPIGDRSTGVITTPPTRVTGSPFPVSQKPDTLYVVDEASFTSAQLITIHTLQGILAQSKPRIYTINGSNYYNVWLADLQKNYGVTCIYTYQADFKGLLDHFKGYLSGYILSTETEPSLDVAVSLAGIKKAVVVTAANEKVAQELGLSIIEDATNENYDSFYTQHSSELNKNILCFQKASKANFLVDYATFAKCSFYYGTFSTSTTARVFSGMNPNSALFGWGDDEYTLVKQSSSHSISVNAADYASNISVFSNIGAEPKQAKYVTDPEVKQGVHTVCFLMTDGDNIQWTLNSFIANSDWYGSPLRQTMNMGWTISPVMAEIAPNILKYYYDHAGTKDGGRDYFVASPSGMGYTFPDLYADLSTFASLTAQTMKKADLRILNILGNDKSSAYLSPFLAQDQIDAIFFYYYSDYSGGNGSISWINGKPVITGRYTYAHVDAQELANVINALPVDITSPNGYSLIPVHVWSENVQSVADAIKLFNSRVRVVTPDEFVSLIKKNIRH